MTGTHDPQPQPNVDALAAYTPPADEVTVFSAVWCGYCRRLKMMLTRSGIPFREVLIEDDPQAEAVAIEANGGDWLIPTVVFSDGSVAVNPGLRGVLDGLARISAAE